MKRNDWHFSDDNYVCNFRSVGVLIVNNKILVQRDRDGTEYTLPGGHVAIGETSEETIVREFKEETGADIICKRMLWVDESFWKWNDRDAHTIAFYYLISLNADSEILDNGEFFSQKDNCDVVLKWVTLDEVKRMNIYPIFIKDKIGTISNGIEHFVCIE